MSRADAQQGMRLKTLTDTTYAKQKLLPRYIEVERLNNTNAGAAWLAQGAELPLASPLWMPKQLMSEKQKKLQDLPGRQVLVATAVTKVQKHVACLQSSC